jgi:hypothetical protein
VFTSINKSQSFTRIRGSEGHLLYHWWEQEGSAEFSIIGEAYEEGLWLEAEADKNVCEGPCVTSIWDLFHILINYNNMKNNFFPHCYTIY